MERLPKILVCDDDPTCHIAVKLSLKGKMECKSAYNGDEALLILKKNPIDLILLDVNIRTADEGLEYVKKFKEADPDLAIVMCSATTQFETVREAMRLGAADYIPKDYKPEELLLTINRAIERKRLLLQKSQQNFEAASYQKKHVLIGESHSIIRLRKLVEKMRTSQANVLITGETGTGKEVVARLLRKTFPDGSLEPFVAVDSATIQSSTAESVLFGHEKGSFTGAEKTTKGIFEEASGGIVYFDEIGNMPLDIQSKLLRALQEREIVRVGSSKPIQLEFRVIAATNLDPSEMVKNGLFKHDLFQRLNVLPIHIPALRDRKEDVARLAEHFLKLHSRGQEFSFSKEALGALSAHSWPGNVRELSNVISYLVTMADTTTIELNDLPPQIRSASVEAVESEQKSGFYGRLKGYEKGLLESEYARSEGNISRLASQLGMDRSHLYTKLKEHGIHPAHRADPKNEMMN